MTAERLIRDAVVGEELGRAYDCDRSKVDIRIADFTDTVPVTGSGSKGSIGLYLLANQIQLIKAV